MIIEERYFLCCRNLSGKEDVTAEEQKFILSFTKSLVIMKNFEITFKKPSRQLLAEIEHVSFQSNFFVGAILSAAVTGRIAVLCILATRQATEEE